MRKPEILSPAGDLEKLKTAVHFGADAVYLGGRGFNLRAGADGFNGPSAISEAIEYAHSRGVKVYVTVNAFALENDLPGMSAFLKETAEAGADAFIISDPGVFALARKLAPDTAVHISTQANTTNSESVKFWHGLGASRIILARECSLDDIKRIRENISGEIELEAFVHGAMCVAYSGRCLLSKYLLDRGANRGDCAQPCRYKYRVHARAEEESRPGLFLPVEEDEQGTAIFSASDMRMVEHLPELCGAGLDGLKIEGRMKTAFYVGLTTLTYRRALDEFFSNPERYEQNKRQYAAELEKCAHRGAPGFSTGFYFGKPLPPGDAVLSQAKTFVGIVLDYNAETGIALIEQRNKFSAGDEVEVIRGKGDAFTQTVRDLSDEDGSVVISAPHPKQRVYLKTKKPVRAFDLLCKGVDVFKFFNLREHSMESKIRVPF